MPGFEQSRFVDLSEREANHLKCGICLHIFDAAVIIIECGHTFCKDCVQQWIAGHHNDCPVCKTVFTRKRKSNQTSTDENLVIIGGYIFRPNFTANGMIAELNTKCQFEANGCQEVLELARMSAHLKDCPFGLTVGTSHESPGEATTSSGQTAATQSGSTGGGQSRKSDPNARARVIRCVNEFIHAGECEDDDCGHPSCHKLKLIIAHTRQCPKRVTSFKPAPNECPYCRQLFTLCCYHAKSCQTDDCSLVYCGAIKKAYRRLSRSTAVVANRRTQT